MSKQIFILLAILVLSVCAFAQTEKYSTPTIWENYSVSDKNVTAQMPKLPVLIQRGNACRGEESSMFFASSDGVVYALIITSKVKIPEFCYEKENFSKKSFNERIKNLKNENKTAKVTENGNEIELIDKDRIYKLINDYENKRWFELQIYGANESKAEVKNFLDSLKIEEIPNGKEIGKGALRNYGDENTMEADNNNFEDIPPKTENSNDKVEDFVRLKVVAKSFPSYTETARRSRIQGTVKLKIIFLANGGIGTIEPLSTLPDGLTEQAIIVASKLFFIPAKRNGKPISVANIVEYHFNFY